MPAFVYDMLPSRVIFGAGRLDKLPEEILRLGATRTPVLGVASDALEGPRPRAQVYRPLPS